MISWIIVIAALVIMDQVTKLFAVHLLAPVGSVDVIPEILRFTYVENRGAAFGMLADNRWVFLVVSTIAIVALFVYMWRFRPESKLACLAIAMIISGGIGNMIDRVRLGYVVDFIDFCALGELWQWVFNVADACVCVGGGLLVLWLLVSTVKDYKTQKAAKEAKAMSVNGEDAVKDEPETKNKEN